MPLMEFDAMPDAARVWVFGAAAPVTGDAGTQLLSAVDRYLAQWKAHGAPLHAARAWASDRFLAVAVDEQATGASGCSIDGMFRVLADAESSVGTSLIGGGVLFWRGADGAIRSGPRSAFVQAAKSGALVPETPVFDTTVTTVGEWRKTFERPAGESWHWRLVR